MGATRERDLEAAVRAGILSAEQAERLAAFQAAAREREGGERPRFTLVHVLYYLGGLIAVGTASLFMAGVKKDIHTLQGDRSRERADYRKLRRDRLAARREAVKAKQAVPSAPASK
ncbi:MAG TPA: hypothetical protein VNF69_14980 [Burkholderiales bacterium]|nr:hypothetical protein [Burkholderiales bacterium]